MGIDEEKRGEGKSGIRSNEQSLIASTTHASNHGPSHSASSLDTTSPDSVTHPATASDHFSASVPVRQFVKSSARLLPGEIRHLSRLLHEKIAALLILSLDTSRCEASLSGASVILSFAFLQSGRPCLSQAHGLKARDRHHSSRAMSTCRKIHTIPRHNHLPSIRAYCCAPLSDLASEGNLASRQACIAAGLER